MNTEEKPENLAEQDKLPPEIQEPGKKLSDENKQLQERIDKMTDILSKLIL